VKIKSSFILTLLFLSSVRIFPQQKLTINEVIKIALENNYDIRFAKSDAAISDNNYSLAMPGFYLR